MKTTKKSIILAFAGLATVLSAGCDQIDFEKFKRPDSDKKEALSLEFNELGKGQFANTVLNNDTPTLIEFWKKGCIWCERQKPVLDNYAQKMGDNLDIVSINIKNHMQIAREHGVTGTPTMAIYVDGKKIDQKSGYHNLEMLESWVGEHVKTASPPPKPVVAPQRKVTAHP